MIAIADYGMGNLRSVEKAFQFLGFDAAIIDRPEQGEGATHLVLPGDAAFGDAMRNLVEEGWVDLNDSADLKNTIIEFIRSKM